MLELVKSILDILTKGLYNPDLNKIKDKKRIGDIGATLFLLHTRINDILNLGSEIIHIYENYIYNYENGNYEILGELIKKHNQKIMKQTMKIEFILHELNTNEQYINVLVSELKYKLVQSFSFKSRILASIHRNSLNDIFSILDKNNDLISKSGILNLRKKRDNYSDLLLYSLILENKEEYHEQVYEFIKFYTLYTKSKDTLIYIKEMNNKLRDGIERNFPKEDILLSISRNSK